MGDVLLISTADDVCGCDAFQHSFQLLIAQKCAVHQKFLISLKSDRHSLLIAMTLEVIEWR
jgi:hypothetical protein